MSTETRLKRLGLWHLRNNPDELEKAMQELEEAINQRKEEAKRVRQKKNQGKPS